MWEERERERERKREIFRVLVAERVRYGWRSDGYVERYI